MTKQVNVKPLTLISLILSVLLSLGCSDGSNTFVDDSQLPQTLTILVTNDDGIDAPGIDTLVNALLGLEDVLIEVVAPAENQSGSSDKTTDGEVVFQDSSTVSGYMGVAVFGFPADAVNVALDDLGIVPNLVVSGVNTGQNVGPLAAFSGTVGAARTAARAGYPAVAASASLIPGLEDYDAAAAFVVDWINANRTALADGTASAMTVTSFNVPGCTAGEMRELVAVPLSDEFPPEGINNIFSTDCSVEPESPPTTDVDAMVKGYAAVTDVPLEL